MRLDLDQTKKKKPIEYFNFWQVQNKITLFCLIAILLLSALFVVGCIVLPALSTTQFIAFIVLIPTLACFGIATCHSSNLESANALREHQRLLQRLTETEGSQITLDRFFSISSDLMAVAGPGGRLKKVSTSLVNTLGYSEKVLLETPFFDFIHPEDQEPTRKNIEALNLGLRSVGFENRYRTADGNYRTFSWSAAADAELGVRFASARDITEERNFKSRMQQILDSVPFLLVVQNLNGVIINCNAAYGASVGASRESLIGKKAEQFLAPEIMSFILEKEQDALSSQAPISFDEVLVKDGVSVRHLSTIFPISDHAGEIVSLGRVSLNVESFSKN